MGDLRTLSLEQLESAKKRMREIVAAIAAACRGRR